MPHFHLRQVSTQSGVRFAAVVMLLLVIISYSLFIRFLRGKGQESFCIRNELELAHGIQKTLVPPISLQTRQFELYGRSDPSDKVGGDLVDALRLDDGFHLNQDGGIFYALAAHPPILHYRRT
jgi:serine phosphatase RsbU (regulator of sigma subunit)